MNNDGLLDTVYMPNASTGLLVYLDDNDLANYVDKPYQLDENGDLPKDDDGNEIQIDNG